MPHHRSDVLAHAVTLLDAHGLAALTMRRLGAELDVQPSAIYHHFASKQALLAAVADEILARGSRPRYGRRSGPTGCARSAPSCATRCSPAPTAPTWSRPCGPSGSAPRRRSAEMEKVLTEADVPDELVAVASRTLVHYVFGHAFEEQTARQAVSLGAVERLAGRRCPTSTSGSTW